MFLVPKNVALKIVKTFISGKRLLSTFKNLNFRHVRQKSGKD